jgi:hypothetical protein
MCFHPELGLKTSKGMNTSTAHSVLKGGIDQDFKPCSEKGIEVYD